MAVKLEEMSPDIRLANRLSIVDYARKNGFEISYEDNDVALTMNPFSKNQIRIAKDINTWFEIDKSGNEITRGNTVRFAIMRLDFMEKELSEDDWTLIKDNLLGDQTSYLDRESYNIKYRWAQSIENISSAATTEKTEQQTQNTVTRSPLPSTNQNVVDFPNSRPIDNISQLNTQPLPMPMAGYRSTFTKEQMAEILAGIKKGINVAPYDNVFLKPEQMRQVRIGIQNHINPHLYNFPFLPAEYMKEVRLTIQKRLNTSFFDFNNNGFIFTAEQVREIRKGQENGLKLEDVKFYARPYLDAEAMKEIRIGLLDGFNQMRDLNTGNYSADDIHKIRLTLTINKLLHAISTQLRNLYERIVDFFYKIVERNLYKGSVSNENTFEKSDIEKEAADELKDAVTRVFNSMEERMEDLPMAEKEFAVAGVLEQLINHAEAMEQSTEAEPAAIMEQSLKEIVDAQTEFALQQRAFENHKEEYISDFYSSEDNYNIRQVEFSSKVMTDNSLTQIQKVEIITETLGSVYGEDTAVAWSKRIQTETEIWKDGNKMKAFLEFEEQQMQNGVDEDMEVDMER